MNTLLRKVARQLRYRPLPELIGTRVTIASVETVPNTVAAAVATTFPLPIHFAEPKEPWITVALAKYCHLDLTFAVEGVEWQPSDIRGTSILKELYFAAHPADIPEEQRQIDLHDDDPTCVAFLGDDIAKGKASLRLFIEEVPHRDLIDHIKALMTSGKGHLLEGSAEGMSTILEDFFPHKMAITDACLTNAPGYIWLHKHFYL